MLPNWMAVTIGTLTILSLLLAIWAKGVRPLMIAVGQLLKMDDKLDAHLKDSHEMWANTNRRLNRIENKIDKNGHS